MALYFRLVLASLIVVAGCASKSQVKNEKTNNISLQEKYLKQKSTKEENNRNVFNPPPPPKIIRPPKIQFDPFKDKFFSFNARNTPVLNVLYAIANDVGMNLVVAPDVDLSKTITANFNRTSAKNAIDIVMDLAGFYYEIKGNVIFVKATMTKTFHIPYVHSDSNYKVSLGGDVLGSAQAASQVGGIGGGIGGTGGTGTSNQLTGNFSLKYKSPKDINDFYGQIEQNVAQILEGKGNYSLNRFTGTLVVKASKDKIKLIKNFLNRIKRETKKQVLIEAKIVEVTLSNKFEYGIDWSLLLRDFIGTGAVANISQSLALPFGNGQVSVTGADFSLVLNALSSVGKVETLSNPRIRVINGQSAIISTGRIVPFWEKQVQTLTAQTTSQEVTYIRNSVLDGILLGVSAYINEDGTVTLNIVPVSSKIEGTKKLIENGKVQAEAPILNIKETGTIIKARNNDLIIIGGLIGTDTQNTKEGIPYFENLPVVGKVFQRNVKSHEKKELIIFLKPTLIKN